jgi:hypothetical protein
MSGRELEDDGRDVEGEADPPEPAATHTWVTMSDIVPEDRPHGKERLPYSMV